MILVDTSIWIDHLHHADPTLSLLLSEERVLMHPFVLGELALGSMKNRREVLSGLIDLPRCIRADDAEVLYFIDSHNLFGLGIGYIDTHLLASTRTFPGASFWTRDKRLLQAAVKLSIAFVPDVN